MSSNSKTSRRSFIKKSTVAFAGISIIPRHVLGQGFIAPSDQLNIGVIGGEVKDIVMLYMHGIMALRT